METDNPDLRDRAYIYWRLLSTDPEVWSYSWANILYVFVLLMPLLLGIYRFVILQFSPLILRNCPCSDEGGF